MDTQKKHIVLTRDYMKQIGYGCDTDIEYPYSMYINKEHKLTIIYYERGSNSGLIQIKRYAENKTLFGGKLYSKSELIGLIKNLDINNVKEDMTNKYYVPKIEEFYNGFEYEECMWIYHPSKPDNNFKKKLFRAEEFIEIDGSYFLQEYIDSNVVRVKYLDKEDIESFGFTEGITMDKSYHRFDRDGYCISTNKSNGEDYTNLCIYKYFGDRLFEGRVKNKSELRKILTQIEIIDE